MMKTLEIIHLRLAGNDLEGLTDVINDSVGPIPENMDVRIYRNSKLRNDLAIHLHRKDGPSGDSASEVGLRLAALLKEYGMVAHSLWTECCRLEEGSTPDENFSKMEDKDEIS